MINHLRKKNLKTFYILLKELKNYNYLWVRTRKKILLLIENHSSWKATKCSNKFVKHCVRPPIADSNHSSYSSGWLAHPPDLIGRNMLTTPTTVFTNVHCGIRVLWINSVFLVTSDNHSVDSICCCQINCLTLLLVLIDLVWATWQE